MCVEVGPNRSGRNGRTTLSPTPRGEKLLHRDDHSRRSMTIQLENDDEGRGDKFS